MSAVLVTGATGFVGSHMVLELLARTDAQVYCLVRNKPPRGPRERLLRSLREACEVQGREPKEVDLHANRLHIVEADLLAEDLNIGSTSRAALRRAGIGEIWHVGASLAYESEASAAITAANVKGTEALLALANALGAPTFNYVSTAYVAGRMVGQISEQLRETQEFADYFNAYEQSKAAAERAIVTHCEAVGMDYRILRPSVIIGDSRTFRSNSDMGLYGLIRRLHVLRHRLAGRMPGYLAERGLKLYGEPDIPINLLPIDHLIRQVFAVWSSGECNRVYNIVNPNPPRCQDVASVLGACLELRTLEMSEDLERFASVDLTFRESYEFYANYMRGSKAFACTNTLRHMPKSYARTPLVTVRDIERYTLSYIASLRGSNASLEVFDVFRRDAMEERTVCTHDGLSLTYFAATGDKPVLVLVNAFGMDLEFWGPTVQFFKHDYRIITWNQRGLPDASLVSAETPVGIHAHARDLRAILEAEGVEEAIFMGWCSGPKIALEYYRHYPESVRALLLVAGKYDSDHAPDPESSEYSRLFTDLNATIAQSPQVADLIVQSMFHERQNSKEGDAANSILSACSPSIEFAPYASAPFKSAENLRMYSKMSRAYCAHDVYDMLHDIKVPTLVVAAGQDSVAHPSSSARVARHIPTSDFVTLPNASHFCLVENPGVFVHTLARFLRTRAML
jgi:pimeloyl-ACP methyl ester carboxylesterase/nucleoside-diphosphate-sugar epimerase